ncbi:N-alpha-acetyltransferase 50 [Entophlyctis luteolus]|nr:N-alpha-acetyltransferase 50 [Entophlyctis luteolus]KAJ3348084.1 N-alpha-acetyltransferase 50 [Entophlyctis luteolus]
MTVTIVRPTKFFRSSVGDVTPNNLGQLKIVVQHALSSADSDALAKDAVSPDELSKLAYFNDVPVGAVVCRKTVDPKDIPSSKAKGPQQAPRHTLSMLALCVLPSYRDLGLESVESARTEKTKSIECAESGISDGAADAFAEAGFSLEAGRGWFKS